MTTILQSFANTPFYVILGESTDPCGRSICAIDVAELYDTNHRTIEQFVNNVNRKVGGDNFSNLKFLITDGATYMLKAGLVLKEKN